MHQPSPKKRHPDKLLESSNASPSSSQNKRITRSMIFTGDAARSKSPLRARTRSWAQLLQSLEYGTETAASSSSSEAKSDVPSDLPSSCVTMASSIDPKTAEKSQTAPTSKDAKNTILSHKPRATIKSGTASSPPTTTSEHAKKNQATPRKDATNTINQAPMASSSDPKTPKRNLTPPTEDANDPMNQIPPTATISGASSPRTTMSKVQKKNKNPRRSPMS